MREGTGTQSEITYIGKQQATVEQWMMLLPIFEVCAGEKGYDGGGRNREVWRYQEAAEK